MAQQAQTVTIPRRLPLIVEPENRDETTAKDARLVNAYLEAGPRDEQGVSYTLRVRPGLGGSTQPSGGAAVGQGTYFWRGSVYSIFGGQLYKDSTAKGAVDTTNGVYRFSASLGATPRLQLGNGVKAYNYDDTSGLVQITDVDFPAAFQKGWGYLDGTTYVVTAGAAIKGSDIDDTVNWNSLNTITAQIEPDGAQGLAKQLRDLL